MAEELWTSVDHYLQSLSPEDQILADIRSRSLDAGLPDIAVTEEQGRFLTVLARSITARSILEIGTLGGFSAVCLARGLTGDGMLTTLEVDARHAEVAREHLAHAGLTQRASVILGSAAETLPRLEQSRSDGFDLIFIDADKEGYPEYWKWALRLSHTGSVIVADNTVREGGIADPENRDVMVQGVREYLMLAYSEPRVMTSTLQTVGGKGYDGISISVVL